MKEKLIFTWIPIDDKIHIGNIENNFHKMVVPNTLGLGGMEKISNKVGMSINNEILTINNIDLNFEDNPLLLEWLKKVNANIRELKNKKNAIKDLEKCNTGLKPVLIEDWSKEKYVPHPDIINSSCVKAFLK